MQKGEYNPTQPSQAAMLEARWQRFGVHRANRAAALRTWSTGWSRLDALLPGGGYPLTGVTEFLIESAGQGELSLLLAGLKPQLERRPEHRLVFVEPPHRLNAPALDCAGIDHARVPVIRCRDTAERVWSIEQLAAAGGFVAFVIWDDHLDTPQLRRLQLASEKAGCPVFAYRDLACARHRSPAALRLALHCRNGHQRIEILKCRGPAGGRTTGLSASQDRAWMFVAVGPDSSGLTSAEPANSAQIPPSPIQDEFSDPSPGADRDPSRRSYTR
ncbi:translesion DNA synthesis-associated protein ImuA [Salinisphaera hydrothermalis]|uniref:translesion DNA synthesis-associated protein ImuA n=1 Tax=Salinisphaera hydrothermalis TaxID=563188 RepID=UPI00334001C7